MITKTRKYADFERHGDYADTILGSAERRGNRKWIARENPPAVPGVLVYLADKNLFSGEKKPRTGFYFCVNTKSFLRFGYNAGGGRKLKFAIF
jgi:hypothetical protein